MLKLKTKWFHKWTKKNNISNEILLQTIKNIANSFNVISLGSNLFKVRVPKQGKGKSGGYRTLVVYRKSKTAIFVYGFAKNEKDNLEKDELKYFKKFAKDLLKINESEFTKLKKEGAFFDIEEEL